MVTTQRFIYLHQKYGRIVPEKREAFIPHKVLREKDPTKREGVVRD